MKNKIFPDKSRILVNRKITAGCYRMVLKTPRISRQALPGQFLEIKVADSYEPFLRRPFGVHRVRGENLEILYEVVGKATEILAQKKAGEYLDVIGPLGNGFRLNITHSTLNILVAGGMCVAPLMFLAEKLAETKHQVLIGAKTKSQIFCEKEFQDLGSDVKISTDDGSQGFKGKVTDLLQKILPHAISHKPLAIYACGPRPMLQEISRISKKYNIPAQISLEEHMACGIGACLGCVVNTMAGYARVCKEGPVFDADKIVW